MRNIRSNYLADKVTYTSSTMPIGAILPVFKADDDKVSDDGVVTAIAQYAAGTGTGYQSDLMSPAGYPIEPIEMVIGQGGLSVSNDTFSFTGIGNLLSDGDKIIIKSTSQSPNKAKLGGSIQSFTVTAGGTGYTSSPTVVVGDNGSGPVTTGSFQVVVNAGVVTGINVVDGGIGYQFPTVTLVGGGGNGATATVAMSPGGTGGVAVDAGLTAVIDIVTTNTFRLARNTGDIAAGYFYNITDLGSAGNIVFITSEGFGLRVGIAATAGGAIDYATIKQEGYGYASGDVLKVLQAGSDGLGKIRIQTVSSNSASDPDNQYPGFLYCDGATVNAQDYPLLYEVLKDNYGGTGGSFNKSDFGSASAITFDLPDYKTRKLVGAGGGVQGGGSPVSGSVISSVGNTGGKWYFSKSEQQQLMDIGSVVVGGYDNVVEFVGATLSGEVTMKVGPLQEKMISAVPEHEHAVLTSEAPEAGAFEGAGYVLDDHSVGYKNGTGSVNYFIPSGGVPLFHSHGITDYIITDPNASTYGNVSGIGTKVEMSITQAAFNTVDDTVTITAHGMATGHKLRVKTNPATNPAVMTYAPGNPPAGSTINVNFAVNTEWWVIKIDNDTIKLCTSKYNALRGYFVDITTTGDSATMVLEVGYNAAGNFPGEPVTTITTPAPTTYDIDDNYVIGGKPITLPGDSFSNVEWFDEQITGGTYSIPASTNDQTPVEAIAGYCAGGGGVGASTDIVGAAGLDSYYEVAFSGYTYKMVATGGGGGVRGDQGGAGGSGGTGKVEVIQSGSVVQTVTLTAGMVGTSTVLTGGASFRLESFYAGNDGGAGGSGTGGTGAASALIGGSGGNGSRTLYTGSNNVVTEWTSGTNGGSVTYQIPNNYPVSQVQAELKGGGGGSGGTGDGGANWYAGDGGHGKHVIANINTFAGQSLTIYVGNGGSAGSGRNPGAKGAGFSEGGNGGSGTGGGGGGGGGGSSCISIPSGPLIGAGGGGGGGAAGDSTQLSSMNGQPSASQDAFQSVSGCFAGSGNNGGNSVCTGGGGGGGGGGVGAGAGIGGGGGGGNGSNAVKPGFGGTRGQSSLVSGQSIVAQGDATNGGDVNIGQQIDGSDGYVKLTVEENTTYYGNAGGGGGSGCYFTWKLEDLSSVSVNGGTMIVGNGNEDGRARVGYAVVTSDSPNTGTSTTVGLFDAASDSVDYVNSGNGSGANGGFISPDTQKYLRFFGDEANRWARTIAYNASQSNPAGTVTEKVRFEVVRGNGSNGGETPNEPLELFGSNDGGGSYTKFGTISTSGGATTWEDVDVVIPTTYRVSNLLMEVRQVRASTGNADEDNYGIGKVTMIHAEGEVTTYVTQAGRIDLGVEYIQEVIPPQGDPINSAGITVNDGKFTLSSAVKLNVIPSLQPDIDIPLVTRYHLVKYMIRAY